MFARITLDTSDYDSGLDEASKNTATFADKLKTGLATAAKVGTAALTAAATGVAALTKVSIDQYAEYEQLVGGVDTLFKDASDTIQEYAANAYKTAGVSANTYMQQATAFSASLIQSLGGDTEAAAEYANQAIMDMSDNANKMGTDIESIQATYQSLMRGNYAMLDNLKLGYGGTKAELERLVDDAEKLTGQALDPSKFSDVITAIHAVQENMGITGTTAAEAATTIEGSVGVAKAAWSNLVTGIADENADLDKLINDFVDSAATAAGNIIPRVQQILSGIGSAITQMAPVITDTIPQMIVQALPGVVSAGAQLLVGLVQGIMNALPQLAASVPKIVGTLVSSISNVLPSIMESGRQMLSQLTSGIETGLPEMVARLPEIINAFVQFITDNLPSILDQGVEIINSLVNGIIDSIPVMLESLPEIITSFIQFITDNLPTIIDAGIDILLNLVSGIVDAIPRMVAALPDIISAFAGGIADAFPDIIESGVELLQKFWEGIASNIPELVSNLPEIIDAIIDGIGNLMGGIVDVGKNIVRGLWDGISSMGGWIADMVGNFVDGLVSSAKSDLGIASPSKVFAGIGENMALGLGQGWDSEYNRIRRDIEGGMNFGTASVDFASSGLGVASSGMINGISSAVQSAGGAASYTFNLLFPDYTKLASYTFQPMVDYAKANGTPILAPS